MNAGKSIPDSSLSELFAQIEPAAAEVGVHLALPSDILAKYSIAISMKRIADFLAVWGTQIETDIALSEKSNGSEH